MWKNFPIIFGGVIAYLLLMLYVCTVIYMINNVFLHAWNQAKLKQLDPNDPKATEKHRFPEGIVYVVTTVGGLVSALVIARLAVTKPGENPAVVQALDTSTDHAKRLSAFLVAAYLLVWLVTGLSALVIGVMIYPGSYSTLGEIGSTWLGLAIASGYAYFGLKPAT